MSGWGTWRISYVLWTNCINLSSVLQIGHDGSSAQFNFASLMDDFWMKRGSETKNFFTFYGTQ